MKPGALNAPSRNPRGENPGTTETGLAASRGGLGPSCRAGMPGSSGNSQPAPAILATGVPGQDPVWHGAGPRPENRPSPNTGAPRACRDTPPSRLIHRLAASTGIRPRLRQRRPAAWASPVQARGGQPAAARPTSAARCRSRFRVVQSSPAFGRTGPGYRDPRARIPEIPGLAATIGCLPQGGNPAKALARRGQTGPVRRRRTPRDIPWAETPARSRTCCRFGRGPAPAAGDVRRSRRDASRGCPKPRCPTLPAPAKARRRLRIWRYGSFFQSRIHFHYLLFRTF